MPRLRVEVRQICCQCFPSSGTDGRKPVIQLPSEMSARIEYDAYHRHHPDKECS
jgi:hypothetical protein